MNPDHLRATADVNFEISETDMAAPRDLDERDYGDASVFPVYSAK